MARIRSLHPGQWTDEAFVQCSAFARLLALGLRNEADDQGVFEWKPTTLKMRLFPADSVDVAALLVELEESGQIRRFEVAGKAFGAIRNFRKWQRPEKANATHPLPDDLRAFVYLSTTDPQQSPTAPRPSATGRRPENIGIVENQSDSSENSTTAPRPVVDQSSTDRRPFGEQSPKVISEEGGRREEVVEGGTGKTSAAQPRARGLDPEVQAIIAEFDAARVAAFGAHRARLAPHATDTVIASRWVAQGLTAAILSPLFHARHRAKAQAGQEPIDMLRFLDRAVAELGSPSPSAPQPAPGNVHTHPAAELEQRKAAHLAALRLHLASPDTVPKPPASAYGLAYNRETQQIMLAPGPRPPIPAPQHAPQSAPEGPPERVA